MPGYGQGYLSIPEKAVTPLQMLILKHLARNIWFFAVFSGMQGALEEGFMALLNPKGIESISPGLRGTSYPGCEDR